MSDLATLRAIHLAAAMQSDHVSDLQRLVRAGVQALMRGGCNCTVNGAPDQALYCRLPYHASWDASLTQSDIARALGISRQRVGQLAAEPVDDDAREAWRNLTKEHGA